MRMESAACRAVNHTHSSTFFERSVLQDIANDTRKCSTASTTSSTDDFEITGYRSFPVDDDLFDSNSTSLIFDLDSANSFEETGMGSLDESCDRPISMNDSPALVGMARTTARAKLDKVIPVVPSAITDAHLAETVDVEESHSDDGSQKNFSMSKEHCQSYYVQGEDISPDNLSNCSSAISMVEPNEINTHCPVSNNSMPFLRTHEVWKEIDSEGGILEIPGCGVSFHVLPSDASRGSDWLHRNKQKQNPSSSRRRLNSGSTNIDRRMVLALDDVPTAVNDRSRVAVGSMVSVEYGNPELLSQGAVLQIDVNVALKEATEQVRTICILV